MTYVVTLTGGKNNSGDFLIKKKAHDLIQNYFDDIDIVDINGWEVSEKDLELINGAKALLLTGGPALIPNVVPAIYSLENLIDEIQVPIATFGVGWFHANGDWKDLNNYNFNKSSQKLFNRLANNGITNSVRDYFTYQLLKDNGVKNVIMTGCPVLFNGGKLAVSNTPKCDLNVAVSLGVGFKDMDLLFEQTIQLLDQAKIRFNNITAVFHHGLEKQKYVPSTLTKKQNKLVKYLEYKNIKYVDASGSAEALMSTYDEFDLHLGYRVHAHLYMLSQGKPSYLIAEDGRGTGQQQVLGELNFKSYKYSMNSKLFRGAHRLGLKMPTKTVDKSFVKKFIDFIDSEVSSGYVKNKCSIYTINQHFISMKKFLDKIK